MRSIFGEMKGILCEKHNNSPMDNLSPLTGLFIYEPLNQGLTPLAISLPALRACILMVFENAVNELRCPLGVAFSVAPCGACYL